MTLLLKLFLVILVWSQVTTHEIRLPNQITRTTFVKAGPSASFPKPSIPVSSPSFPASTPKKGPSFPKHGFVPSPALPKRFPSFPVPSPTIQKPGQANPAPVTQYPPPVPKYPPPVPQYPPPVPQYPPPVPKYPPPQPQYPPPVPQYPPPVPQYPPPVPKYPPPVPQYPPPQPQYPPPGPQYPPPVPQYPPPGPQYPPPGPQYPPPGPQYPPPGPQYPPPGPQYPPPGPQYPPPGPYYPPPGPQYPHPYPIYPYPVIFPVSPNKTCDGCDIADAGFEDQRDQFDEVLSLLEELKTTLEACDTSQPDQSISVRRGNAAGLRPTSTALCPPSNIVLSCRCSIETDQVCRGVLVTSDGLECVARTIGASMAIAICVPNNDNEYMIANSGPLQDPEVTCPRNTIPVECWIDKMQATNDPFAVIDYTNNRCLVSMPCEVDCQLSLLCKRNVSFS